MGGGRSPCASCAEVLPTSAWSSYASWIAATGCTVTAGSPSSERLFCCIGPCLSRVSIRLEQGSSVPARAVSLGHSFGKGESRREKVAVQSPGRLPHHQPQGERPRHILSFAEAASLVPRESTPSGGVSETLHFVDGFAHTRWRLVDTC